MPLILAFIIPTDWVVCVVQEKKLDNERASHLSL